MLEEGFFPQAQTAFVLPVHAAVSAAAEDGSGY
jgi:hypothetical protein